MLNIRRQRNTSQINSSETDGIFRPQADWANSPERVADMNRQYNEWVSQIYRQYYSQYMNNV